ncbi:MAG: hypothetical protein FD123_230 [Bacteroidetes bacterium]|nr:MAG: hypothetical protein FD123_230 [Bacteroidota bacterium]
MKRLISCLLLAASSVTVSAQNDAAKPRHADSLAIRETILNYVEGFYYGEVKRMEKAVHPELAKRIIVRDTSGVTMVSNMGSSTLIYNTSRQSKKAQERKEPIKTEILVYDIFKNIATAKASTDKFSFIDYVQLGKINGEWKIVNVLWEFTGEKKQ